MKAKMVKWGNSLAVRIPKPAVEGLLSKARTSVPEILFSFERARLKAPAGPLVIRKGFFPQALQPPRDRSLSDVEIPRWGSGFRQEAPASAHAS